MKHMKVVPVIALAVLLGLAAGSASAATTEGGHAWCGSGDVDLLTDLARHQRHLKQQQREMRSLGPSPKAPTTPKVTRNGDVAIIEDDGSIIASRNLFDLDADGIRFRRKGKKGFKISGYGQGVKSSLGDRLSLGDDDSAEVDFPDGFTFRFFGEKYRSMFVNSDGNITFGAADNASTARSLGRLIGGPPRIAPFFDDFDPSRAQGTGGVYVRFSGKKAYITWFDVPEFDTDNLNTFQVVLTKRGNVEFAYGQNAAEAGVVGLSPGGANSGVELFDYTADLPAGPIKTAIAEQFATEESIDGVAASRAFFGRFADRYSHLIFFTDFRYNVIPGQRNVIAFHLAVQNQVRGIGRGRFDGSAAYGSGGGMKSYVMMGAAAKYDSALDALTFGTLSNMGVIGHEVGHKWQFSARYRDENGNRSNDLHEGAGHYIFHVDTDASVNGGNEIADNGDGSFTTLVKDAAYSPLDLYLMGLLPPEEVPDFFYVRNGTAVNRDSNAQFNVTFIGDRYDLSVDDIIAAEGPRQPAAADAEKNFNLAFILIARKGQPPGADSVALMERLRSGFERWFRGATGRLGRVRTELVER